MALGTIRLLDWNAMHSHPILSVSFAHSNRSGGAWRPLGLLTLNKCSHQRFLLLSSSSLISSRERSFHSLCFLHASAISSSRP
jgi:hypothetical protein